jgi:uncharacterized protein
VVPASLTTYLYAAMTDVATLAGAPFDDAVRALFSDVVDRKMYITGGLGAEGHTEAFGDPYVLPNKAYAETCASIGGMLWYHRMFLRDGQASHYDALERTLYNGYLSGVSLAGNSFFYQNPLVSDGRVERSSYFDVACCPANLARLMAQLPGLIYAQDRDRVYVNLFIGSDADLHVNGVPVTIAQRTDYPWNGTVTFTINPQQPVSTSLAIRIPSWTEKTSDGGAAYQFATVSSEKPAIAVNGKTARPALQNGYATISREWKKGDTVTLTLPMPVRRVRANDNIAEDRGKAAIQRGPIIYCVEGVDNGGSLTSIRVPLDIAWTHTQRHDLLNGVGIATATVGDRTVTAIPYYAWNNRGKGEMEVWVPY